MPQQANRKGGRYPGWPMVWTAFTAMATIFTTGNSLMPLFIGPMSDTFKISTTAVSIQFSLITFSSIIGSWTAGPVLEKLGLRKAMATAGLISALSRLGLALSPSIWLSYFFAILAGLVSPIVTTVGIPVMVNRWFGKKISGQALGIAMTGSGLGAMVLTPILSRIIAGSPGAWRHAYLFLAGLILIIYVPMVFFFVKECPEMEGIEKAGQDFDQDGQESIKNSGDYGLTLQEAKASSSFSIAIFLFGGISFISLLFFTLSFDYFSSVGYGESFASTLLSIQALALIFGKYGLGVLASKTNPFGATLLALVFKFVGLASIIFSGIHWLLAVLGVIFFGLGNAASTISIPLVTEEVFGNIAYGQIVSIMNMAAALASALAPMITTATVNGTGSKVLPWVLALILLVFLFLATLVLQRKSRHLESQRLPDI